MSLAAAANENLAHQQCADLFVDGRLHPGTESPEVPGVVIARNAGQRVGDAIAVTDFGSLE
ncbi:hypothetical protein ACFU53_36040 [Streptomyces sp. NPDC057474]|uniref:hypothetical protein n=1 Tax=Streptomyces sp. NPDC057474 TaxID=3346144 RepID=UPI0036758002